MAEMKLNRALTGSRLLLLIIVTAALLLAGQGDRSAVHVSILVDRSDGAGTEAVDAGSRELAAALQGKSAEYSDVSDLALLPDLYDRMLRRLDPGVSNGLVIASPGYWPAEMQGLLEQTAAANIPVYWLPVSAADPAPSITRIDAPARARVGEQVAVTVNTAATDAGTYRVVVFANGEPVGQQELTRNAPVAMQVDVAGAGVLQLDAELLDGATGQLLDRLQGGALVNIVSAPRLLYLTNGDSPFAKSLAAGGWSVEQMSPREFQSRSGKASGYNAIVLDDVPADSLPEAGWQQIAAAVRQDALGLLVLGGPQSFGLGGYRGSTLEELLPVVSEPPSDEPPASVIFLVDVSGSMARPAAAADKLRVARAAVLNAAAALRPQDRVGLVAFDVEAQQLLAIEPRDSHAAAIGQAWPAEASGGTGIVPALDLAQAKLAVEASEQKLLFLVTDGMLSDDDIRSVETRLAANDFELVTMIMLDDSADAPLSRLSLGDRGSILMVDDVLRLPVLMRDELEERRAALEVGRTNPSTIAPVPLVAPPESWPAIDAYVLTRPRPEATVMVATERRDPILATWTVGTGKVLVVTSGLNRWAADWLDWERWPELAAGLVNFVAVSDRSAVRIDTAHSRAGRQSLLVERGSRDGAEATLARLVLPNGLLQSVPLLPVAPGVYEANVETEPGRQYTLAWNDTDGSHRHSFIGANGRDPGTSGQPAARRFAEMGLLREWSDEWKRDLAGSAPIRKILAAIALFGLLIVVAVERVPLSQLRRLLPTALSRLRY